MEFKTTKNNYSNEPDHITNSSILAISHCTAILAWSPLKNWVNMIAEKQTMERGQILPQVIDYFNGDELAATTWLNKYALRDFFGNFLESTPDQMHQRMAKEFARIETNYGSPNLGVKKKELSDYGQQRKPLNQKEIYSLFKNFKYLIPQGSVMANLGNEHVLGSLSNCIVLPAVHDSYSGISYTDQQMIQLFKRRCGVGIDISNLRPSGMHVANSAGSTSGAVSFMERFSNTTREVAQNGRRGALMITMDIRHPDILDFITVKQDLKKVTGANISVKITDAFMESLKNKEPFTLQWPIESTRPQIVKEIDPQVIWDKIITCAHNTAEPGVLFWDHQHYYSTSSVYPEFKNVTTNPCSEIAMQGSDSCRLMALNLYSFVKEPFSDNATFDFTKFYNYTYEGQRLMDDLVDLEIESIDKIIHKIKHDKDPEHLKSVELETWEKLKSTGQKGRRTGLGFTALADTIAALNLKLDSKQSLEIIEKLMLTKCTAEFDCSIDMAIERGGFEGFSKDIEQTSSFVQHLRKKTPSVYKRMMKHGRRNISISTVAPTGSLSLLAQTSSGIEPVFMLSYKRRRKLMGAAVNDKNRVAFTDELGDHWEEFEVFHPKLRTWQKTKGIADITKSPYYGCSAPEIDWKKRIDLQSIIQKYVTHSISSTINLPADTSQERIAEIYAYAWEQGLKGITVYREGSRDGVLVDSSKNTKQKRLNIQTPPKRPEVLEAQVLRFINQQEEWLSFIGILEDRPYEIFTGRAVDSFKLPDHVINGEIIQAESDNGKRYDFRYFDQDQFAVTIQGLSRCFNKEYWNYAKLISGVLRYGMPITTVVDLVDNLHLENESINSWKTGIVRSLKPFIPKGAKPKSSNCPSCEDPEGLIYEEGCLKCKSCGYSKCG